MLLYSLDLGEIQNDSIIGLPSTPLLLILVLYSEEFDDKLCVCKTCSIAYALAP